MRTIHANIFMDHFEKKYIYSLLQGLLLIYVRFIDDIFFIWTVTKEQLTNCLNNLNKKHNSIKCEDKLSQTSISLLNTEVSIQNNQLITKIYRKNTDRQNFFQIDSDHPESLKNSIPCSQALRIKRICTATNGFNLLCEELIKKMDRKTPPQKKQKFH